MSTTVALTSAVTEALVRVLPTGMPLESAICAAAAAPAGRVAEAVIASFVGATSADLALVLSQPNSLGSTAGVDSPLISGHDVLRPALESAAAVLGAGVLADSRVEDASTIFTDPTTTVYELTGDGGVTGWFAIRLRSNGVVGGDGRRATDSVTGKLGRINNVEMSLTVEIGRARMSVRDVLSLEPGAVIELDRSAGAPADVLLNGRLIAHGEIVVVDQDYAVRITKILDVAEVLR